VVVRENALAALELAVVSVQNSVPCEGGVVVISNRLVAEGEGFKQTSGLCELPWYNLFPEFFERCFELEDFLSLAVGVGHVSPPLRPAQFTYSFPALGILASGIVSAPILWVPPR